MHNVLERLIFFRLDAFSPQLAKTVFSKEFMKNLDRDLLRKHALQREAYAERHADEVRAAAHDTARLHVAHAPDGAAEGVVRLYFNMRGKKSARSRERTDLPRDERSSNTEPKRVGPDRERRP